MVLTRIISGPSSTAKLCISPTSPALAAEYELRFARPTCAPEELVRMIDPPRPPARRCGMVAEHTYQWEERLMSTMVRQSDGLTSWAAEKAAAPAVETTMSSPPSSATPASTAALT